MIRTQVYLTEKERRALREMSAATGRPFSELIREAVDLLVRHTGNAGRKALLESCAGMWRDRESVPDPGVLRDEWERGIGR
jgi:hypothetical protein